VRACCNALCPRRCARHSSPPRCAPVRATSDVTDNVSAVDEHPAGGGGGGGGEQENGLQQTERGQMDDELDRHRRTVQKMSDRVIDLHTKVRDLQPLYSVLLIYT